MTITLADIQARSPEAYKVWCRQMPESYEDFVDLVLADIREIMAQFEAGKNEASRAKSENEYNLELVRLLQAKGYHAAFDQNHGGHADILIQPANNKLYRWIGEGKKFDNSQYKWLFKGFLQLITRYSSGSSTNCCGGLVVYCLERNTKEKVERWIQKLQEFVEGEDDVIDTVVGERDGLEFQTRL